MTQREYRITTASGKFSAEMRLVGTDDELFSLGILPGWHSFKRSASREKCEEAIRVAREQAS